MILYPAIDIMDGRCVRLHKGDFTQSSVYGDDPHAMADSFAAQGGTWVHIVDLDGARDSAQRQDALISAIVRNTSLSVQTGGGIRSIDDIARSIESGAARVVVGSLAVREPDVFHAALARFGPDKLCLATDARAGADGAFRVAVAGWQEDTDILLHDLVRLYEADGLTHLLCTDIARDGTLQGPNVSLYADLHAAFPALDILASGGIHALEDFTALAGIPVGGAVVGKALYEGVFTLAQAQETLASC